MVILPDGRKAELIQWGELHCRLKLEDGREILWPREKLPKEQTAEPEFNMVIIPAIDRLEEMVRDRKRLMNIKLWIHESKTTDKEFVDLFNELFLEARNEFNKKWGLADKEERGHSTNEAVKGK